MNQKQKISVLILAIIMLIATILSSVQASDLTPISDASLIFDKGNIYSREKLIINQSELEIIDNKVDYSDELFNFSVDKFTAKEYEPITFELVDKFFKQDQVDVLIGFPSDAPVNVETFSENTDSELVLENFEGFSIWNKYTINTTIDKKNIHSYTLKGIFTPNSEILVKYNICFKPTGLTFREAINNKLFYCIDPWFNTTYNTYQASATTSNSVCSPNCGQCPGPAQADQTLMTDGNSGTCTTFAFSNCQIVTKYLTYNKTNKYNSSSQVYGWPGAGNFVTFRFSDYPACWNASNNFVNVSIQGTWNSQNYIGCYNGTGWQTMYNTGVSDTFCEVAVNWTVSNTQPIVNANFTNPTSPILGSNVTITINATDPDDQVTSCSYTVTSPGGSVVINNVAGTRFKNDLFNSTSFLIQNLTSHVGLWNINTTCADNDTTSVAYGGKQWGFTIADNTTPTISITSPSSGYNTNQLNILFNFTTHDDVEVSRCRYWIYQNGILDSSAELTCNLGFVSFPSAGSYEVNLSVNDTSGNTNFSQTITISINSSQSSGGGSSGGGGGGGGGDVACGLEILKPATNQKTATSYCSTGQPINPLDFIAYNTIGTTKLFEFTTTNTDCEINPSQITVKGNERIPFTISKCICPQTQQSFNLTIKQDSCSDQIEITLKPNFFASFFSDPLQAFIVIIAILGMSLLGVAIVIFINKVKQ